MPKVHRLAPLLLLLAGCRTTTPPAPAPVPRTVVLAAGTPVKLILFDELTSGGSKEGTEVRLVLAEPLEGLPKMSPARAVVAWSRSEGTLGGLMNRPARLTLTLKSLTGPNGEEIPLSADPKEPEDYELNRANTGRPDAKAQDVPDPKDEAPQLAVRELIERGQSGGLDAQQVGDLARKLGMDETAKVADAGRLKEVQSLCRAVRDGTSVAGLASGGTVAAAMELVHLAGDVGQRLGRSLGGRNIRAYPGTEVPAYVVRETRVTLPAGS